MLRCRMGVLFLVAASVVGMLLPAVAQATVVTINPEADCGIEYRADLWDYASGYRTDRIGIGGEKWSNQDLSDGLFRLNFSSVAGKTATGDGTLTLPQAQGFDPTNFTGQALTVYRIRQDNNDWAEGTAESDGATLIRKRGGESSPPDVDKWLPIGTNRPYADMELVATSAGWSGSGDIAITVPQATVDSWVAAGSVSLLVRSESVWDVLEASPDTTNQMMYRIGTRADSAHCVNLTADFVPEPTSLVLVVTGALGLLAYAWRKRK